MTDSWRQSAFLHAHKCHPHECCGMIIQTKEKTFYGPCRILVRDNPEYSFVIDPNDWAYYEDQGEVVGIVHSHPDGELKFSEADITSCNHLDVDFYLVDPFTESMIMIEPEKQ